MSSRKLGRQRRRKTKKAAKPTKTLTKRQILAIARREKRKALSDWSRKVRARDGCCAMCGRTDHLNAHHILPKEHYKQFMFEMQNGISLCAFHHRFGWCGAHKHSIMFAEFLRKSRPEQFKWAVDNMGTYQ